MNKKSKLIEAPERKSLLSTLWIFVMLCIAYADIIGMLEPGTLEKMMKGDVGFTLTPTIFLVISLIQAIPIAMIVLARIFRRDVNRWLNILSGVLTLLYVAGGGNWESSSYVVFFSLEFLALLAILCLGWTWRKNEA